MLSNLNELLNENFPFPIETKYYRSTVTRAAILYGHIHVIQCKW